MTEAPSTSHAKVREFYEAFSQPLPEPGPPSLTNEVLEDRIHLKMDLIAEEFFELVEAVYGESAALYISGAWSATKTLDDGTRDVAGAADALSDLDYVLNGLALEANIPHDEVMAVVHASNMSKLGEDGKPVLSDGVTPDPRDDKVKPAGKVLKGPNFWEPNLREFLFPTEAKAEPHA